MDNEKNFGAYLMPATYFFLGVFSIMAQTMMTREFLVAVHGHEFILGVLFFNWLIGIFLGSLTGAAVKKSFSDRAFGLPLCLVCLCLILPLVVTAIRFLPGLSATPVGTPIGFFKIFLFSALSIIPLAFFIGLTFPLAAGWQVGNLDNGEERVRRISHIYIIEALGFLLGGIAYTVWLAGRFSPYTVIPFVSLPLLSSALVLVRSKKRYLLLIPVLLALAAHVLLALPFINKTIERLTALQRWRSLSPIPLIYSVESRYQNISVTRLAGQYQLYLNAHFAAAFPEADENRILAGHLVCQHPDPKRILIMGDGLTGLCRYLLDYRLHKVTVVEIDPEVKKTVLKFLPPNERAALSDPRLQILIKDGRRLVKELIREGTNYDIIFLNLPEPSTLQLNRYYTREFFADAAKILTPSGYLAFRLTSSENYGQGLVTDYTASLYHTLKAVFPYIVVSPGPTNFLFASRDRSAISTDPAVLAQRFRETGVNPKKLGLIFYSLYPAEKTAFIRQALENSPRYAINRDEFPRAPFYFSQILGWYGGADLAAFLGLIEKIESEYLLLFLPIFFLAALVYIRQKRGPGEKKKALFRLILFSVASCGLFGLTLELIMLYTFQVAFGYIYHLVGVIIGIFMGGLPLGAMLANKLLAAARENRESVALRWLVLLQVLLSLLSIIIGQMTAWLTANTLGNLVFIMFLTFLAGFFPGMVFPLSLALGLHYDTKVERVSGAINAADHLGAALGALLLGTLLLPLLGISAVCLFLAGLLLVSALLSAVFPGHTGILG